MRYTRKTFFSVVLLLFCCVLVFGCSSKQQQGQQQTGLAYKTIKEADGQPMATVTATILDGYTKKYLPKSKLVYYNSYADCLTALKAGKVEGFLCDEPVAREMQRLNPDIGFIKEVVVPDLLGIGIPKTKPALKQLLDAGIKRYEADGTLKKLDTIWFGSNEALKKIPEDKTGSKGTLICAVSAETPPMSYIANGQIVGYEVSLVKSILQEAGYRVQLQPMGYDALIPSVTSGKADLIFGGISITEERKQSVLFSEPDYKSGIVLVVKNKGGTSAAAGAQKQLLVKNLQEADGKPMGVVTGKVFDTMMPKYLPKSPFNYYNNFADCLAAMRQDKIIGFLCDEPIAREMERQNPDIGHLKEMVQPDPLALGVSKARPELKQVLDAGIARYKQDGTMKKLDNIWFGSNDAKKQIPALKNGSKGVVICGVNAENPPMEYVKDGKIVGYVVDLTVRILQEAGYTVKLQNMSFDALIPSLATGKIDMIVCSLSITEERKQSVLFTEPFYESGVVLLTKVKPSAAGTAAGSEDFWTGLKTSFYRNFLVEDRYKMVGEGLKTTIYITICAAVLGTLIGFIICMLRRSSRTIFNLPAKIFVKVMQGTPLVVFLMIMYYIVFGKSTINPVYVAILAFGINMGAYVSEMMRTGIAAVDQGQLEAAYAMGFTKVQTFVKIVTPQALKYILPVYTGELISLLKMTSVVGYIAIQDLTKMSDIIRSRTYEAFFPLIITALIYLVVSWGLAALLMYLEYRIDPKKRPRTLKGVQL